MNLKLWNRREPLKSALLWAIGLVVLSEGFLLLGGKWVLIDQSDGIADDAYYGGSGFALPPTRSWRVLDCTYWTGRSIQHVEFSEQYGSAPRECAFITEAQ